MLSELKDKQGLTADQLKHFKLRREVVVGAEV
jgi:hypothetical protein